MKQPLTAVMALALGAALAATAQAHGTTGSSAALSHKMGAQTSQTGKEAITPATIKQAQQQLKSQGFYRGPIDGKMGRQMKTALSQFQRRNGLQQTARLDRQTLDRLMGGTATTGFGSSTPGNPTMPPSTAGGTNGQTPTPSGAKPAPNR